LVAGLFAGHIGNAVGRRSWAVIVHRFSPFVGIIRIRFLGSSAKSELSVPFERDSPENCTVTKLYANRAALTSKERGEKYFSKNLWPCLQLICEVGILTFVVIQRLNKLNAVKRAMFVSAIVAVGLLDLGFTTYLSHEDLFDSPQNIVGKANALGAPSAIQSQITLPEVDTAGTELDVANSGVRATWLGRTIRQFREFRPRATVAALPVKFVQPATPCRTVSYPFVGDQYVVQVTDETACMNMTAAKFRREHLIAQNLPRRPR
jgi:hypothetical protein